MPGQHLRGGSAVAAVLGLGVLLGLVAAPAAADARPDPRRDVTPIVECSVSRGGVTKTVFGYENRGSPATVGVGESNAFSPGPPDRGQPTRFVAGTRINVFTVQSRSRAQRLTWTLGSRTVQTPGPPCASSPASSTLANWGPIGAIVSVTLVLGALLFWRTRRLRVMAP